MKGLFAWVGFNAIGVPYERPARAAGATKFNLWRLWNFALDGVVSFSTAPLRAWFYVGGGIAGAAFLYAMFIVGRVLIFGVDAPGYASLLVIVLMMGGIQLLSLGIIGEYLGRLFLEVKGRPIYVVEGVYEEGDAAAPQGLTTAMDLKEEDILGADIETALVLSLQSRRAAPFAPVRLIPDDCSISAPARDFSPGHLLAEVGAESALCVDTGYARDHDEA